MNSVEVKSIAELNQWMLGFCSQIVQPQIFLLSGDLGAGKTQFVKSFIEGLGGGDEVYSPSFALINEYNVNNILIHHVDLYRLEDEDDIESTGFWDLFAEENGLVFIEWPERLNLDHLPHHWPVCKISIQRLDSGARRLTLEEGARH